MKSIIFIIFFVIFLQESHQNLMWKIVTNSNLNPLLKLYFYSPILANNNILLKIYCENIMVEFLNYHFFSFLPFYHSYVSFLLFFSLDFSPPHTYSHISHPLPFCFLYFPLSRTSLSLSFSISLLFFFFFFYLIPKYYPALSVIRNGERGRERKNRWVRWLRSATAARLPPQRSPDGRWLVSFFLFSFFFLLLLWFD